MIQVDIFASMIKKHESKVKVRTEAIRKMNFKKCVFDNPQWDTSVEDEEAYVICKYDIGLSKKAYIVEFTRTRGANLMGESDGYIEEHYISNEDGKSYTKSSTIGASMFIDEDLIELVKKSGGLRGNGHIWMFSDTEFKYRFEKVDKDMFRNIIFT